MFLQEASENLQYLREYVSVLQDVEPRREDLERLYISAHTLSGTSASYGFPRFSEIAGKLAHVFQYALNAPLGSDMHGPLTEFLSDGTPSTARAYRCQEARSVHIEKRAQACRQFPKIAGIRNSPKCRSACAPKCKAVPDLPGAAPRPEARSRIPANTAGSPRLPGGKLRRLRGPACSRSPLLHEFRLLQFIRCPPPVENAIAQNDCLKLHRHLGDRLRGSKEQVPARFQSVVEPLHQSAAAFFREIDQHVHAKNHVHAADVHRRGKVHLRERNHLAQSRLHLVAAANLGKMICQLLLTHTCGAAALVDPALGMFHDVPPSTPRKECHVPGLRQRNPICDGDSDGVRLLACGTTGAPNPQ